MSLQAKILSLLAGVIGAESRMGVAASILYVCNLYLDGVINEDQARTDLFDICFTVIRATNPDLLEDEARKKANQMVDEIIRSAKLMGMQRRMFSARRFTVRRTTRSSSLFENLR